MGSLFAYAVAEVLLVLINEFPLFALLLRAKYPFRLPGEIFRTYPRDAAAFIYLTWQGASPMCMKKTSDHPTYRFENI